MANFALELHEVQGLRGVGVRTGVVGEDIGPDHLAYLGWETQEWGLRLRLGFHIQADRLTGAGIWRADCARLNEIADGVAPAIAGWIVVPDGVGVAEDPSVEMAHLDLI